MGFKRESTPELPDQFPIQVNGLYVQVGADTPLSSVDLTIEPGEYLAITGPSGSGKTTLANYMLGLSIDNQPPQGGEVLYGGVSIYELSEAVRTRLRGLHFGVVPQAPNLLSGFTAMENITMPTRQKGLAVNGDLLGRAMRIIDIERLADKPAEYLSGGERHRVSIARALAHNPGVLVLDEPTANLDPELKQQTNGLLKELADETGKTVVVVTHEDTSAKRQVELIGGVLQRPKSIFG